MKGVLLIDKPSGPTSHDVVDHVRKAAGIRRVGHTGTLDPRATGLLLLCLGQATRLSEHLTRMDKTYEGTMRLGMTTDSYDLDGEVVAEKPVPGLAQDQLAAVCARFTGDMLQTPPMVSAVKVGGERLYKLARKGQEVERPPRPICVHEFAVLGYDAPDARIRVRCSSGAYVRGLVHDVGQALGCGAVLAALRRTRVGKHDVADAAELDALTDREAVVQRLLPIDGVLDLPEVVVSPAGRRIVAAGGALLPKDWSGECPVRQGWVQIKSASGELLALGRAKQEATTLLVQPKRVLTK